MPIYTAAHPYRAETIILRQLPHRLLRWGGHDGVPVLLLHGWMDGAASFQFLIDALPPALLQRPWLALDWRGFGGSAWHGESYYFPDYLADLDALIRYLSPAQPLDLVGHSMGGIVACLYAGLRPQAVRKLVSLEGFGLPATQPAEAPGRLLRWLDELGSPPSNRPFASAAELAARLAARLAKANPALSEAKALWLAQELGQGSDGVWRYRADPRHRLVNPVLYRLEEAMACWRQVSAPTLWLAGDEAKVLSWLKEDRARFQNRLDCFADLRYQQLPHCGHNLHHDDPAAVAAVLAAFLL